MLSFWYLGRRTLATVGRGHIRYLKVQFLKLSINQYLVYAHPTTVRLQYRGVFVELTLVVAVRRLNL